MRSSPLRPASQDTPPASGGGSAAERGTRDNPALGILCKVIAHLLFALMFAAVRWLGPEFPTGQIVFWRSFVGMAVIVAAALLTGGPALLATRRLDSHALRSIAGVIAMFCNFTAFAFLPLAEATTLSFAAPLFMVLLAALILGEAVHVYRWSAVIVGFVGVVIILVPYFELPEGDRLMGALLALSGAGLSAMAMIFLRRMSTHEHSITIAFYFMLVSTVAGAFTAMGGWVSPSANEMLILVGCGLAGGVGQIFLSFSFRYAEVSALAAFDYTALLWSASLGYFLFGELPPLPAWIGAAIIVAAGLFILWRERRLGKERALRAESL
jgi:drug/metabolite transporter (DMT)-like permease